MSKGITDPNELRKMAGFKRTADVYRTLDKLAIRKEYHNALAKNGISLDYIVEGLKSLVDSSEKEETKLRSLQTLLKSLGLERYEKEEDVGTRGWEEAVINASEKKEIKADDPKMIEGEVKKYKVDFPEIPEDEKEKEKEEIKLGKELYGNEE